MLGKPMLDPKDRRLLPSNSSAVIIRQKSPPLQRYRMVNSRVKLQACCCGRPGIRTALIFIVFAEIAALTIVLIMLSIGFSSLRDEGVCYFLALMVALPVYTSVAGIMLWGMTKEVSWWLIPHMIVQVLAIIFVVGIGTLTLFGVSLEEICTVGNIERELNTTIAEIQATTISGEVSSAKKSRPLFPMVTAIFFISFGGLQIYFLIIILQAFQHLRFKERTLRKLNAGKIFRSDRSRQNNFEMVEVIEAVDY